MSQLFKKQTSEGILYNPTLSSVLMVEETIQKHSQECGKYQLWKKLPNSMMYQSYLVVLDYLIASGKIMIDNEGCVIWTYNPERIRNAISKGLIIK
ncbi:MAG: hypothetical protein WCX73_03020 [Candidatus Pacearchaeota archaeon]|jgi:hypothetical protein